MEKSERGYSLVRESSFYDRMFFIYHRLGIQSNILVSARYTNGTQDDSRKLTKPVVVAALHATIKAHPTLQVVGVVRPSPSRGCHRLHRALLHVVDAESQVEFLNDTDNVSGDAKLFTKIHAMWDWTDDEPTRPWWKVFIVGGSHVIFVYHHFVADGMSGHVFHREFLNALNTQTQSDIKAANANPRVYADIHTCVLPREPLDVLHVPRSTLITTFFVLLCVLADLFLKSRIILHGLPRPRPYFKTATEVAPAAQRTRTNVVLRRIPSDSIELILRGCRKNQTSFTALLTTMWMATLSKDYSPKAIIAATQIAADTRPQMDLDKLGGGTSAGVIVSAATSLQSWHILSPFRGLFVDEPVGVQEGTLCKPDHAMDVQHAWEVAKELRRTISSGVKGKAMRAWGQGQYVTPELERFVQQILPVIGYSSGPSLLISNLGVFDGYQGRTTPWSIVDMQFSAAATNGNVGPKGIVLNVAGVKGKDTVIAAVFEEDIVESNMVEEALERTVLRMETLVKTQPAP